MVNFSGPLPAACHAPMTPSLKHSASMHNGGGNMLCDPPESTPLSLVSQMSSDFGGYNVQNKKHKKQRANSLDDFGLGILDKEDEDQSCYAQAQAQQIAAQIDHSPIQHPATPGMNNQPSVAPLNNFNRMQSKESLTRREMVMPNNIPLITKHEVTVFGLLPPNAGSSGNLYGYGIGGLERMHFQNTISMRKDSIDLTHENTAQHLKVAEYASINQIQQHGNILPAPDMPSQLVQPPQYLAQFTNQGQSVQQLGPLFGGGHNVAAMNLMSSLPSLAANSLGPAPHGGNFQQVQFEHEAVANMTKWQPAHAPGLQQVGEDNFHGQLYGSLPALGSDVKPGTFSHNVEEHKGLNLPVSLEKS